MPDRYSESSWSARVPYSERSWSVRGSYSESSWSVLDRYSESSWSLREPRAAELPCAFAAYRAGATSVLRPAPLMRFFAAFRRLGLLAVLLLTGLVGCRRDRFADGIGRPTQQPIDSAVLVNVAIVEVYPAASGGYVELLSGADVDLTGFSLATRTASIALSGSIGTGQRLTVPVTAGQLDPSGAANLAQSGEVALVDAAGVVHSYFAWGADPSSLGSVLFVDALQSGAPGAAGAISVPFPRPDGTAIVREGGFVGCYAPTDATPPADPPCATPAATLALREVAPFNSPLVASYVEIENVGTTGVDVGGVRVCHESACVSLAPGNLDPAGVIVACLGTVTSPTVCPAGGVVLAGSIAISGDSETYLAAPGGGSAINTVSLLDYMRTSLGTRLVEETAIADNVWLADAAPIGTYVPGESLSRNPGPLAPPVWNPARATPGTTNPTIDRVTNWQTCAEPATAATSVSPLIATVLSRIDGTITLLNTNAVLPLTSTNERDPTNDIVLADHVISIDGTELTLPSTPTTLRPNSTITVAAAIGDAGKLEIRLRAGNVLEQFAQWGNPAAGVSSAVAANLWPRGDCILPRLAIGESLVLRDRTLIRGSGGYGVQ